MTAGNLLQTVTYAPTSQVTYTATGSYTVMDATNLTISFTVPSTGNFYVDVGIDWAIGTNGPASGDSDLFLGLAKHGTTAATLVSVPHSVGGILNTTGPIGGHTLQRFYSTGNTASTAIQLDLIMGLSTTPDYWGCFYVQNGGALSTDPTAPCTIQAFEA